jgi:molybdopterin converting factor small subunit
MAVVWIPPLLRDLTGGSENESVAGDNVLQLIDALDRLHPGVKARLCDGDELRSGIAIVVDGHMATLGLLQPTTTAVEVHFLPAVGGG